MSTNAEINDAFLLYSDADLNIVTKILPIKSKILTKSDIVLGSFEHQEIIKFLCDKKIIFVLFTENYYNSHLDFYVLFSQYLQITEYKTKKIIPLIVNLDVKLPNYLRIYKPIYLDLNLDLKLDDYYNASHSKKKCSIL